MGRPRYLASQWSVGVRLVSAAVRLRSLGLSAGLLAVAALGTSACAEQTAAARVGDATVSESELMDEIEVLADLSSQPAEGDLGSSYSQTFVGRVLQQRIVVLLIDRVLDEEGAEVTDEDRAAARQQIEQRDQAFADVPSWYQDVTVDDFSKFNKLAEIYPDDSGLGAIVDMAERVDVELSSRYGSWDPSLIQEHYSSQFQAPAPVVPPRGPEPAPNGEGSGDDPTAPGVVPGGEAPAPEGGPTDEAAAIGGDDSGSFE
jgi:hypothetical protein